MYAAPGHLVLPSTPPLKQKMYAPPGHLVRHLLSRKMYAAPSHQVRPSTVPVEQEEDDVAPLDETPELPPHLQVLLEAVQLLPIIIIIIIIIIINNIIIIIIVFVIFIIIIIILPPVLLLLLPKNGKHPLSPEIRETFYSLTSGECRA
jgi:TRAP-type uncharacterized transport system fused permease subunit